MIEEKVKKYFDKSLSERERAIFETGIALGFVYHQFIGMPFNSKNYKIIKKALEKSVLSQPYRKEAKIKIKIKKEENHPYSYNEIIKENFEAKIKIKYSKFLVTGRLKFIKELNYPLMYVEKIEEKT